MKRNKTLYNIFIGGFVILYIATALISLCHAIEFFTIGNVKWMAITLATVFELGQMIVLSSLLLSDNKKTLLPWILLTILTSVQVVGNVYSVYKYITLSATEYYVYLQKPLIDWWLSGVSQEKIIVIISWIIGALLPIIALFMTSMVANNIKLMEETTSPIEKEETPKEEDELPLEVEKEPLKVPEEPQNKEVPVESPPETKHDEKRHMFFSADTLLGKK